MTICKMCGQDGLRWVQAEGKWRLFSGETLHLCGRFRRQRAVQAAERGKLVSPWSKDAPESKPAEGPPEPVDYMSEYFSFLDAPQRDKKGRKKKTFKELIP